MPLGSWTLPSPASSMSPPAWTNPGTRGPGHLLDWTYPAMLALRGKQAWGQQMEAYRGVCERPCAPSRGSSWQRAQIVSGTPSAGGLGGALQHDCSF